ncbi:MAG: glycosyltransferase family 2 protein [Patescibacteria group bacterium]|nr:glycosyltransferase family 2 protein [Patescibacteria group bacterium]
MIKLSVVIPAYNEEKRLPPTLEDVFNYLKNQNYAWEILVVNDGSTDNTAKVVNDFKQSHDNVRLIDNKNNQGKGGVVKQGMLEASGAWRLFMDADNSTRIKDIAKFWPHTDEFEILIGSRYTTGSVITEKQSFLRRFISRAGNTLTRILILPGIADTQCGFKLFSARACEKIFPKQTFMRWSFDMEILSIAKRLGYKIKEIPITWENAAGSKLPGGLKVAWRTIKDLFKIKWNLISHKY